MFEELLQKISLALEGRKLPYMIIGGQAVLVHGEPRLTRDIDVTLGVDLCGLNDVLEAARTAKLTPLVEPDDFTRKTMVLPCNDDETGIRVDFVFSSSAYERAAIGRGITVPIGDARVRFATAEDLVIHKIIAGRARDLEDARSVLIKNPRIDRELVRTTLEEFQTVLEQPLLKRFDEIDPAEQ